MENIVLHLKLVRVIRGDPLAYMVQHHVKVAHILPGYGAYLNLDEEIITRASIVDSRLNLKLNQESLDRAYLEPQCNKFKINNALMYHILSKMSMDMDTYIYMKQKKETQYGQQFSSTSIRNFSALTMWPSRSQKQKESCKTPTMMVREKHGTVTSMSHSIKNSMPTWRVLQIMVKVTWTMAPKPASFSKASRLLSWRQQSMLSDPNLKSMEWTLMQPCLIWVKWSQRKA